MIANLSEQAITERICDNEEIVETIGALDTKLSTDIKELRKILFGNGEPSKSVVARLERIEENQKKSNDNVTKALWIMVSTVIGQVIMYLLKVL